MTLWSHQPGTGFSSKCRQCFWEDLPLFQVFPCSGNPRLQASDTSPFRVWHPRGKMPGRRYRRGPQPSVQVHGLLGTCQTAGSERWARERCFICIYSHFITHITAWAQRVHKILLEAWTLWWIEHVTDLGCILLMRIIPKQSFHPTLVRGKIVFHETCPWCQKGWGPLVLTKYSWPTPCSFLNGVWCYLSMQIA